MPMKKLILTSIALLTSLLCVSLAVSQTELLALGTTETNDLRTITFGTEDNPFPYGSGAGFCYSDDKTVAIEQSYLTGESTYTSGGNALGLTNNGDTQVATFSWTIKVHGVVSVDYQYIEEGESGSCAIEGFNSDQKSVSCKKEDNRTGPFQNIIDCNITFDDPLDVTHLYIYLAALECSGVTISSLKITYSKSACRQIS